MNFVTKSLVVVALSVTVVANANAQGRYDVDIVNWSPWTITQIHMSPVGADTWGRDLLGQRTLSADYKTSVKPDRRSGCYYDLKVTFTTGDDEIVRNFNLCGTKEVRVYQDGSDLIET